MDPLVNFLNSLENMIWTVKSNLKIKKPHKQKEIKKYKKRVIGKFTKKKKKNDETFFEQKNWIIKYFLVYFLLNFSIHLTTDGMTSSPVIKLGVKLMTVFLR